jgi:hypothetical protein
MMPELKVPVEPKKLATFAAGRGHFALLQLVRGAIDLRGPKGIYLNNYAYKRDGFRAFPLKKQCESRLKTKF